MTAPIHYCSTRGVAPRLDFADTLLAGLANDGGLYVPDRWPHLPDHWFEHARSRPYAAVAAEVIWPFVAGSVERDELVELTEAAYSTFTAPDVVPVRPLGEHRWLAELFHGPTLAFKDLALQLLGRLLDAELTRRGERVTIIGATSGDTGSAAIEACRDRDSMDIVILHPAGRVSEVQRRQMTTVTSANVHNVAIRGTFDDCQNLVKALFRDQTLTARRSLSAVNSINWARVMAQVVYYVTSAAAVGENARSDVRFVVPTGNFGNVLAGDVARRMGLPIVRLVIGSNSNDILYRALRTGVLEARDVQPTLSPSMDIQVSSNFERLLFELYDRDAERLRSVMDAFGRTGTAAIEPSAHDQLRHVFDGMRVDDEQTVETIRRVHEAHGVLIDPHTAVAVAADDVCDAAGAASVILSTAHPAKFPDAVETATGVRPGLPAHLADLLERPEQMTELPVELETVRAHILEVT